MTGEQAPHLTISVEALPSGPVARLVGDLDAATAPQLDAVEPTGQAGAVLRLELAQLSFLDSSGLRSLLALRQRAVDAGLGVEIAEPSTIVQRLLDVTGLAELFPLAGP